MSGHVYRNSGERGWRVQVDGGVDPGTGQRIRIRLPGRGKTPFATRREAEHAAARVMLERAEGRVSDSRFATLSQFLTARWLPARSARGLKPTTLANYEWIVVTYIIPRLGATKLADLRPHHITSALFSLATERGRGGQPRSARTVELTRRVLSMALADAVRWGLISRNPVEAAEADLPRPKGALRVQRVWTPEQLRAFLRPSKGTGSTGCGCWPPPPGCDEASCADWNGTTWALTTADSPSGTHV